MNPKLKLVKREYAKPYQATAKACRKHIKAAQGLLLMGNYQDAQRRLQSVDKALADIEAGK